MKYNYNEIEAKWQKYWAENQTFKVENNSEKPKFYVLDMFPYPSGAGLHVGHPLGYIASDIYARYKRLKGFNVLHPQGYDSFGLPAEQYAIQTGQHPAITTEENIKTYRRQLDKIGFSFDWSREVRTSNPDYYKWTQWIFIQLYNSYYCKDANQARSITELEVVFKIEGNHRIKAACDDDTPIFSSDDWNTFSKKEQQIMLAKYRLTYLSESEVNWCPALGTVLANDEIVNGVSERGGHPIVRKKMKQWSMRISAYAQRLLDGLQTIDWPQPLKDSQTNWIGRSEGASVVFKVLSPTLSEGKGVRGVGYLTGNPEIAHLLLEKAKEMRANPTQAEALLWGQLKSKNLDFKFRQQHLIGDFIVDFVCLSKRLIIEIDGKIHDFQVEKDEERTKILEDKGYKIIRFKNEEVIGEIDKVISKIEKELKVLPFGKDLGWDIEVFTTRPDTIFGVSFMTLAPEHELVLKITTDEYLPKVQEYIAKTAGRSERERMADVKTISGQFTGAYAIHPFTDEKIPIWIGDYVLASYGTGAVMSVPCGDQRDYDFANYFKIPIPNIFADVDITTEAFSDKENTIITNSDFLNGLSYKQATQKVIEQLEAIGIGKRKINYRLRDAVFSRQRYWGEPFPVYYVDDIPQMIDQKYLPIILPEVEHYLPTEDGRPPLGNATSWAWCTETNKVVSNELINQTTIFPLELNTMPGWAGSSWYFNRYMDAHNSTEFASKEAMNYWKEVDLYIGGSEHATGHLLYARFWQKFLFDLGYVPVDEFAKKLINQGMILGMSAFVYRSSENFKVQFFKNEVEVTDVDFDETKSIEMTSEVFLSKECLEYDKLFDQLLPKEDIKLKIKELSQKSLNNKIKKLKDIEKGSKYIIKSIISSFQKVHVDVSLVNTSDELDIEAFKNSRAEYANAEFVLENNKYIVGREVEKMSKSKYNVVNPDEICEQHGADSLRLFEMFLGPLEQSKPWNTAGITGVDGFLKKLWKLYIPNDILEISDENPSAAEFKILHKTIKKVAEDIENFSFNTSVSTFMIAVNELIALKCNKRAILEPLLIVISPYAPHITEELWSLLGHQESISKAVFPSFEAQYLVESTKMYPVSFNGKMKFTVELPLDLSKDEIQHIVINHPKTIQFMEGKTAKTIIIVPGKIVNIVV
jgi:leucyl-tRNA synthetase